MLANKNSVFRILVPHFANARATQIYSRIAFKHNSRFWVVSTYESDQLRHAWLFEAERDSSPVCEFRITVVGEDEIKVSHFDDVGDVTTASLPAV